MIDANHHLGLRGQVHKSTDLHPAHDLIGDQDVADPTGDHGFGLAEGLAAHTDGASLHLMPGDLRAFVGLGVGAEADGRTCERSGHAVQVPRVSLQVHQQGGRIDLFEAHPDLRGGEFVGKGMLLTSRAVAIGPSSQIVPSEKTWTVPRDLGGQARGFLGCMRVEPVRVRRCRPIHACGILRGGFGVAGEAQGAVLFSRIHGVFGDGGGGRQQHQAPEQPEGVGCDAFD